MSVCTLLPYPREIKHPEKPRKSRKAKAPNGYVIYEDSVRVAIATGFRRPSVNAKTGPMLQVWILIKKENPLAAYQSGADVDICGRCPAHEICYVNLGKAPLNIWKTWTGGGYPALPSVDVFQGRKVRFGAYAVIPRLSRYR